MKVTKLIREYVEEEVRKAYDSKQNPYVEQAKKDREMIKAFTEHLLEEQKKEIEVFIEANGLVDSWHSYRPYKSSAQAPSFTAAATEAMVKEAQFKEELAAAKRNKIREIMLQLELGANRAELNAMLSSLLEGV